jgi:hypothetical protein
MPKPNRNLNEARLRAERDKLLERLAANAHYDEKILAENLKMRAALERITTCDNVAAEIARRALEEK